jgi:hypothetical protein
VVVENSVLEQVQAADTEATSHHPLPRVAIANLDLEPLQDPHIEVMIASLPHPLPQVATESTDLAEDLVKMLLLYMIQILSLEKEPQAHLAEVIDLITSQSLKLGHQKIEAGVKIQEEPHRGSSFFALIRFVSLLLALTYLLFQIFLDHVFGHHFDRHYRHPDQRCYHVQLWIHPLPGYPLL